MLDGLSTGEPIGIDTLVILGGGIDLEFQFECAESEIVGGLGPHDDRVGGPYGGRTVVSRKGECGRLVVANDQPPVGLVVPLQTVPVDQFDLQWPSGFGDDVDGRLPSIFGQFCLPGGRILLSGQFQAGVLDRLVELHSPRQPAAGQDSDVTDDGVGRTWREPGVVGWHNVEPQASDCRWFDNPDGVVSGEAAVGVDVELETLKHLGPGRGVGRGVRDPLHQATIGVARAGGPTAPDVSGCRSGMSPR